MTNTFIAMELVELKHDINKHLDVSKRVKDYTALLQKHGINEITADIISEQEAVQLFGKPVAECTLEEVTERLITSTEGIIKSTIQAIIKFIKRIIDFIIGFFKDRRTDAEKHAAEVRAHAKTMPRDWRLNLKGKMVDTVDLDGHIEFARAVEECVDVIKENYTQTVQALIYDTQTPIAIIPYDSGPITVHGRNKANELAISLTRSGSLLGMNITAYTEKIPFEELMINDPKELIPVFEAYHAAHNKLYGMVDTLNASLVTIKSADNAPDWIAQRINNLLTMILDTMSAFDGLYASAKRLNVIVKEGKIV